MDGRLPTRDYPKEIVRVNMQSITIVTCYKAGTAAMLSAWFGGVRRHTKDVDYRVVVLAERGGFDADATNVVREAGATAVEVDVGSDALSRSRVHGMMLDAYVPRKVETACVLTMDSDCFPVSDGWLEGMMWLLDIGCKVVGILHPWAPPLDTLKNTIAWRVRSQHSWLNTHVACQMTTKADLEELGVKFSGGDDTGLLVPKMACERGWKVAGYMPTRCPKPAVGKVDPEFNRYVGLLYGDKVFHLGGFTRVSEGDAPVFDNEFGWVTERVLKEKGAEFLLKDENSYRFRFNKEEEVAAEKMQRLFGFRDQRMG